MAKKAVLKDFSQLKPIEQQRISLVISGIMTVAFKGVKNEDFAPKKGTQARRVWDMHKLDERQQIAWMTFMDHFLTAEGNSGGTTSGMGEYTDRGGSVGFRVPRAYVNESYKRIEGLRAYLSRKELALLSDLVQDTLNSKNSTQLEMIGTVRSGFKDKDSARASGVTHVQCLMDRLADYFRI